MPKFTVMNFVLILGPRGPKGPKGQRGPKGAKGNSYLTLSHIILY